MGGEIELAASRGSMEFKIWPDRSRPRNPVRFPIIESDERRSADTGGRQSSARIERVGWIGRAHARVRAWRAWRASIVGRRSVSPVFVLLFIALVRLYNVTFPSLIAF